MHDGKKKDIRFKRLTYPTYPKTAKLVYIYRLLDSIACRDNALMV